MASLITISPWQSNATSYAIEGVSIDSYAAEPVLANDGSMPEAIRFTISGTGLLTESNWNTLRTWQIENVNRLWSAKMETGPGNALIDLTIAKSVVGGPLLKMTGTQVVGGGVMMVRWELTDTQTLCDTPVVSHTWTQKVNIDARGRIMRTISGILATARNSTASDNQPPVLGSASWDATKPWADLFRYAVAPPCPAYGWRRTNQEFAYDVTSRQLMYQLVDEQFAHDLPDGCRVGDMQFTYERSAEMAGVGICRTTVELEGDMSLRGIAGTTPNRKLLEAAIVLSKNRINANFKTTIITRMSVTEVNLLSEYHVRLEIEAQVFPTSTTGATMTLAPIAFMVGQGFGVARTNAAVTRTVAPYGSFVKYSDGGSAVSFYMVPHWVSNVVSGMNCDAEASGLPYASIVELTGSPDGSTISVAVVANNDGLAASNSQVNEGKYAADQQNKGDESGFAQIVSHDVAVTRVNVDTGMIRIPTMYVTLPDYVIQVHKPRVIITERIEVSRANTAPARIMRPLPPRSILLSEDWNVAFGKFDLQGQRLFTGIYERRVELVFETTATNSAFFNGFYVIPFQATTNTAGDILAWKAPNAVVLPPLSTTSTDGSQKTDQSVLGKLDAAKAAAEYSVAAQGYVNG